MATPIRPDAVTGLKLWFRARASGVVLASGAVSQWTDLSGNGLHALQNTSARRPAYSSDFGDGRPALVFDGIDDGFDPLLNVVSADEPHSILLNVMAMPEDVPGLGQVPVALAHEVDVNFVALYLDASGDDFSAGATIYSADETGAMSEVEVHIDDIGANEFLVYMMRSNGTGLGYDLFASFGQDDGTVLSVGTNVFVLGQHYFGGVPRGAFKGAIREVIVYERELTADEWAGVRAWMLRPDPSNAPVISNVSPTPGTAIDRVAPIFFDVTDDMSSFRRAIVCARFPDGTYEVVHDGDGFAAGYASLSTRTVIANGYRYRVRRAAGWPGALTIVPFVIDTDGNENV